MTTTLTKKTVRNNNNNKSKDESSKKIAQHIRDCQVEVDSITWKIQQLIASLSTADLTNTIDDDYRERLAKIRRLQFARELIQEQMREMEAVLRA